MKEQVWKKSAELLEKYPIESFEEELTKDDPLDWAKESHESAIENAYEFDGGLKHGDTPSQAYITNGIQVAEKRIALAGYRLAKIFKQHFQHH
jgi:hypothetical protein